MSAGIRSNGRGVVVNPYIATLGYLSAGLVAGGWVLASHVRDTIRNFVYDKPPPEIRSFFMSMSVWGSFATQAAILGVATGIGVLAYLAWRRSARSGSGTGSDSRAL